MAGEKEKKKEIHRVKKIVRVKKPIRHTRRKKTSDSMLKTILVLGVFFFLAYIGFNFIMYIIDAVF